MPTPAASPRRGCVRTGGAFTLIELMVSMVILTIIVLIVFSVTNTTGKVWTRTTEKIGSLQAGRAAFETLTRQLGQATLNTYFNYFDANGNPGIPAAGVPVARYGRWSELHFISGPAATLLPSTLPTWSGGTPAARPTHAVFFQAALGYSAPPASPAPTASPDPDLRGLDRLLNATGFYVEFNDDQSARPRFLRSTPARPRYRLMQLVQPSRGLEVYAPAYAQASGFPAYTGWFTDPVAAASVRPLAENIVALVLLPERSPADAQGTGGGNTSAAIAPNYFYDSRTTDPAFANQSHQLPPMVRVLMVAIDETSAQRLARRNGNAAPPLVSADKFQSAAAYAADLQSLRDDLTRLGINYRVFSEDIGIPGSKWSE